MDDGAGNWGTIYGRLRLLGDITLTPGPDPHAAPIPLSSQPTQTLLAYLALHSNQPVDRQQLAFLLWPDVPEATARRNLRQHLHRLRQIFKSLHLPDTTLVGRRGYITFRPNGRFWIDVHQFQQQINDRRWQIEAIELYTGDLCPAIQAEWITPLRTRLREQYLSALRQQITWAKMQRNYPRALHYAMRLLQANPLRESSHRIYMEALYFNGLRAEALRHYETMRELFWRELRVRPMPQTIELYRQIKMGTLPRDIPLLFTETQQVSHVLTAMNQISQSFVARRNELAQLDEALAQAIGGRGRVVLIEGEMGIGKTRLLHTWQEARRHLVLNFAGTCEMAEWGRGGAALWQALRFGRLHINWQWFPGSLPWLSTVRYLIEAPNLPTALDTVLTSLTPTQILEMLNQFWLTLVSRTQQPVVLLLDDLHWADEITWRVLAFLGHRSGQLPLLIVGTVQSGQMQNYARQIAGDLRRQRRLTEVHLWPLSPADTTRLVRLLLPGANLSGEFARRVYRLTEGNPFFVTELVRAVADNPEQLLDGRYQWPRSVTTVIQARLNRLTAESRALLAQAAKLGRRFTYEALVKTAVPPHTEADILHALEEWLAHGLIRPYQQQYEFLHEQIQTVARQIPLYAKEY